MSNNHRAIHSAVLFMAGDRKDSSDFQAGANCIPPTVTALRRKNGGNKCIQRH